MSTTNFRRAVGYLQADNRRTVLRQREAVEAFCRQQGWELSTLTDDAEVAAAAAIRSSATLVVASLECLAPSARQAVLLAERLHRAGVDIAAAEEGFDSASDGKGFFTGVVSLANLERQRIARQAPFGYTVADDLVHVTPDPAEQALLRELTHEYHSGRDFQSLAGWLNARGLRQRDESKWDAQAVKRILDSLHTSRFMAEDAC